MISAPSPSAHPAPRVVPTSVALPLIAVLYSIPVLAAMGPVLDWDFFWHLRAGAWIAENGRLPNFDYGAHTPWVAYSWAFEVLVDRIFTEFGLRGIGLFRIVLAVAITAMCHWLVSRREPRFLVSAAATAVVAIALAPLWSERPWLFTILFSAITLGAVLEQRAGRRIPWIWALPFLYALWANLHLQFVYGLLILGLALTAAWLDRWLARSPDSDAAAQGVRTLIVVACLCGLATLLTPYHARLYRVAWEIGAQPGPFGLMQELTAPAFRSTGDWLVLALALGTFWCLGRTRSTSSFELLLAAVSVLLFVRTRRDLWLVAFAALIVIPKAIPASLAAATFVWTRARVTLCIALVAVGTAALWEALGPSEAMCRAALARRFPERAAREIERLSVPGPVYHPLNWGGYLMWRLPHLKMTIDGRTNLHGDERIHRSLRTWGGQPGWERDADLLAANVVVGESDAALTALLERDPEHFERIYADDQATVFVRRPSTSP
jgi:hypothetical protein